MKNVSSRTSSLKMRLMSALTSIMTLLTVAVPSMTTTVSAETANDGVEIVSDEAEKVKLLVGTNSNIAGSTVEETIKNANATYLLGIASQFGVFLEENFTAHSADVESRLAVGGGANLSAIIKNNQDDFDIGNGDFHSKVSLGALMNNTGYAEAIVEGGPFVNNNVISSEEYANAEGESERLSKTFVIGNGIDLSDKSKNHMLDGSAYDPSHFRKTDALLIDFPSEFARLRSISAQLAEQETDNTSILFSHGIKSVQYDEYEDNIVDGENLDEGQYWNGNMVHFRYNGNQDTNVVKFQVTEQEWEIIANNCALISYEGIPENANVIISVAGTQVNVPPEYKYTYLNGKQITSGDSPGVSGSENINPGNNDEDCERILYNFYDATKLTISQNFAGNIFAPNADVGNDNSSNQGHLSGALIAKSFEGSLEIGYRPYQGSVSLLGGSLGYFVPVQKFDMDKTGLAGATLELLETTDAGNVIASTVVSTGNVDYMKVPTKVDFSGNTDYSSDDSKIITTKYTLQEKSAPSGYKKTDKTYQLAVTETITDVDSNGVPTAISVSLTVTGEENYNQQFVIDSIKDQYDADGNITDRTILIQDGNDDVLFHVLYTAGKASSVTTENDVAVEGIDVTKSGSFTLNDKTYYYDASNALVMPTIDAMTFENEEVGALVKLEKVDQYQTNLNGAVVEIYAQDGTKIASNVSLDRQDGNLIEIGKVVDAAYATKAGTLKPGVYYLIETKAPSSAALVSDKQYFKVNEDGTLTVPYVLPVIQPTSYEISQIALTNYDESAITVESIVIYHADGSTSTASISSDGNYDWTKLDLGSASTSNVTGIEVTASGDGSANITTQDPFYQNINALCGTFSAGTTLIGEKPVTEEPTEPVISLKGDNTIQFQNQVEEEGPVIQISKRDAVGSEEVAGAMLKLTGKDGLDLSNSTGWSFSG